MSWRDQAAAEGFEGAISLQDGARLRRIRVVRDYGMFDRREAPQYSRRLRERTGCPESPPPRSQILRRACSDRPRGHAGGGARVFNADGIELSKDQADALLASADGQNALPRAHKRAAGRRRQHGCGRAACRKGSECRAGRRTVARRARPLLSLGLSGQRCESTDAGRQDTTLVQDARLRWPDTFAQGPDGAIYPAFPSAPRRRVSPVEEGSTRRVVDCSGS